MPDKSQFEDVKEFSEIFDHPVRIDHATLDSTEISDELLHLRMGLIAEEFFELLGAAYGKDAEEHMKNAFEEMYDDHKDFNEFGEYDRDVIEVADALGDLLYVINGTALAFGINLPAVFSEIHRSNMTKLGEDGLPVRSDGTDGYPVGKTLKGPNYEKPQISRVING